MSSPATQRLGHVWSAHTANSPRRRAPALLRVGVVVFALAAAGDVIAHTVAAFAVAAVPSHIATFAGMVLTLAGVIATASQGSQQHDNRR